jgi:hypothetical protein
LLWASERLRTYAVLRKALLVGGVRASDLGEVACWVPNDLGFIRGRAKCAVLCLVTAVVEGAICAVSVLNRREATRTL